MLLDSSKMSCGHRWWPMPTTSKLSRGRGSSRKTMWGRLVARAVLAVLLLGTRAVADPFADQVVGYQIGTDGGAGLDEMPGIVLGPPRGGGAFQGSTDTLSLGLGGWIIVGFTSGSIVDGPGADFTVFENPFLTIGLVTGPPFAEPGTVSVSDDGVTWKTFPCVLDDPPYYPGCAGVYPVFANADDPAAPSPLVPCTIPIQDLVGVPVATFQPPDCSGGDSFDLAAVGLSAARFVRIDASQLEPGAAGTAGFDLDAVAAVHFMPLAPTSTTTTTLTTIGPGTTSTTTPPTFGLGTTSTTLGTGPATPEPCDAPGLDGVQCTLTQLAPAAVCAGQPIAPQMLRTVDKKLRRTRALVGHAARTLAQGKTRMSRRALRAAAHELSGLLTLVTRAPTAQKTSAKTATSVGCRQLLEHRVASVLGAILRLPQ
jgi:hypothetical protein